jgi:hypothetical protein
LTHSSKPPGFIHSTYQVKNWFQAFAFKCNLYCYVTPLIKKHEESIDNALEQGYKKSENTVGLYKGESQSTHSLKAPGSNP